jgi:PleD family two-component response regulator
LIVVAFVVPSVVPSYDERTMILIAVDDLLFSSKIRSTAKLVGAEILFTRTPDEILREARARRPALVIFDLNAEKADPLATIQALKADPELASIRALGFVSHVRADLIGAARDAGAEVLPRSAFAANLGDILKGAGAAGAR